MPTSNPPTPSQAVTLLTQQDLRDLVVLAREAIEKASALPPMEAMRAAIDAHFRHEERSGGLFDCLRSEIPERASEVDRLRGDHDEIRERLAFLASPAGEQVHDRIDRISRVLDMLVDHERRESTLMATAAYRDLEGGG